MRPWTRSLGPGRRWLWQQRERQQRRRDDRAFRKLDRQLQILNRQFESDGKLACAPSARSAAPTIPLVPPAARPDASPAVVGSNGAAPDGPNVYVVVPDAVYSQLFPFAEPRGIGAGDVARRILEAAIATEVVDILLNDGGAGVTVRKEAAE